MKKKILILILCFCFIFPAIFLFSGCLESPDIQFKVENGYVQYFDGETWSNLIAVENLKGEQGVGIDGREVEFQKTSTHIQWRYKTSNNSDTWKNLIALSELKGEDATYSTYTITYDYGIATEFFDNVKTSDTIKSTEWVTDLPTTKSEYQDSFKGWFIADTNKQIENYDFIGGDVTLEARFDITKAPSGLYQNGKYVKTWTEVKSEYPNAFSDASIVSSSNDSSYFTGLSGEFVINSEITSIGKYAFQFADLSSITIPSSVTTIGYEAFYGCTSLTSITIPNSVTSIWEQAFSGCTGLISIVVDENNSVYDSRNNCNAIIRTQTNTLIAGCKNTVIPASVTTIGYAAFYYCKSLTSITIPNSVTSIGDYAFYYCKSLSSITIPNSVTSIGDDAFMRCDFLTSITIGSGVTSVGDSAFYNCIKLKEVIIESEFVANALTSSNSCGNLINYADTVYIKQLDGGVSMDTSYSTYLNENFTKQEVTLGYDKWVRN